MLSVTISPRLMSVDSPVVPTGASVKTLRRFSVPSEATSTAQTANAAITEKTIRKALLLTSFEIAPETRLIGPFLSFLLVGRLFIIVILPPFF